MQLNDTLTSTSTHKITDSTLIVDDKLYAVVLDYIETKIREATSIAAKLKTQTGNQLKGCHNMS